MFGGGIVLCLYCGWGCSSNRSKQSNSRILAWRMLLRAVRYQVAAQFAYSLNCHCLECRRTTGSAFKPFAGIRLESHHVKGADSAPDFGDAAATIRTAAAALAALLGSSRRRFVHVAMGTLMNDPSIRRRPHFRGMKRPGRHHRRPAAICWALTTGTHGQT